MNKIPTIFIRDDNDRAHVTREPNPDCMWVFAGEGIATRKFDGTCVMYDGARWWARREVKPGKTAPDGFVPLGTDEVTGKTMGWESIESSAWLRWLVAAHEQDASVNPDIRYAPGTYELCGDRVNGNPEGFIGHVLIEHATATELPDVPRDFDGLAVWLTDRVYEGIVWHHPDGRMAKIKRRDFAR